MATTTTIIETPERDKEAQAHILEQQPPPPSPALSTTFSRVLSLPTNLITALNPFTTPNDDPSRSIPADSTTAAPPANKRSSILASIQPSNFFSTTTTITSAPAPTPTTTDNNESLFDEPHDTRSQSDASLTSTPHRRRGKKSSNSGSTSSASKPKTRYSICHAPPTSTTRQKLSRRPRAFMQLHRLTPHTRPQPAFEIASLTKHHARLFPGKHSVCPADLIVLRAENYSNESAEEDERHQEAKDVIALICKGRGKDDSTGAAASKSRILFPDAREWEAYPTPNGGYEFFSTDSQGRGITVRWVVKRPKDSIPTSLSTSTGTARTTSDPRERKFNFSTISPNSRRHPIIATLGRSGVEINETFRVPEAAALTPLSSPMVSSDLLADSLSEDEDDDNTAGNANSGGTAAGKTWCETDANLRELITITAIYVALKENWSPFLKCSDANNSSNSIDVANAMQRTSSQRTTPSPSKSPFAAASSPTPSTPASPVPLSPGLSEKRNSVSSRKMGFFGKHVSTSSQNSVVSDLDFGPASPTFAATAASGVNAMATGKKPNRVRADSTSTVLVHRAASNRMRHSQALSQSKIETLAQQQHAANVSEEQRDLANGSPRRSVSLRADAARSRSDGDVPLSASASVSPSTRGAPTVDAEKEKVKEERRSSLARPILPPADSSYHAEEDTSVGTAVVTSPRAIGGVMAERTASGRSANSIPSTISASASTSAYASGLGASDAEAGVGSRRAKSPLKFSQRRRERTPASESTVSTSEEGVGLGKGSVKGKGKGMGKWRRLLCGKGGT